MNATVRWILGLVAISIFLFVLRVALGIARLYFFSGGEDATTSAEAEVYRLAGENFASAVVDQRWPDAYALMTTEFRDRQSLDQFTKYMVKAEAEYVEEGRPLAAYGGINAFGAELSDPDFADTYDIPAALPKTPEWKAYIVNEMVLEVGDDSEVERCYSMGTLMVDEPDGPKVAYMEYWWCD